MARKDGGEDLPPRAQRKTSKQRYSTETWKYFGQCYSTQYSTGQAAEYGNKRLQLALQLDQAMRGGASRLERDDTRESRCSMRCSHHVAGSGGDARPF